MNTTIDYRFLRINSAAVCVWFCVSCALVSISTSYAQESGEALEEVTVTARRVEENLQRVPIAISVLSDAYLRQQNIRNLSDLGTNVPSLRVSNAGTSTNEPIVSVRGQRPTDATLGLDAAIPIYFAEIATTPTQGTNLALYDLQNVQVLKGPQGTLFGRNSTGGALLIEPKKPGTQLAGDLEGSVGNFGSTSVQGGFDIPITAQLQVRLAGRKVTRDGYQTNQANNLLRGQDYWDEDSQALRLGAQLTLAAIENYTLLDWAENKSAARVPVPAAFNPSTRLGSVTSALFGNSSQTGSEIIGEQIAAQASRSVHDISTDVLTSDDIETHTISNQTRIAINKNMSLVSILGYRDVNWQRNNDADGTALPLYGAVTSVNTVTLDPPLLTTEAEQWSYELRAEGQSVNESVDWIIGGFAYDLEGSQSGLLQVLGFNPERPIAAVYLGSPNGDIHNQAWGAFGELNYQLSETLSLTAGLRYSADYREVTVKNTGTASGFSSDRLDANGLPVYGEGFGCGVRDRDDVVIPSVDENGNPLPESTCSRTENKNFSAPTWRMIAKWEPNDNALYYASLATGYRAGGFNLRANSNASLEPFKEEKVLTYELGTKRDWSIKGASLRTNLAIFYQDYKNIQKTFSVDNQDGTFGTTTLNAGRASIVGVEMDLQAAIKNLRLKLGYSFVDADYQEFDILLSYFDNNAESPTFRQSVGETFDLSGGKFAYIPEHSLTSSIEYDLYLPKKYGELSFMLSGYWQSKMYTDETSVIYDLLAAPTRENWRPEDLATAKSVEATNSYWVVNARIDWFKLMGSQVDLALFTNNLLDEEYIVGGLNVIDTLGFAAFTYGPPRTLGAALRYQF